MTAPARVRKKPKHPPLVPLRAIRESLGISVPGLAERIAENGFRVKHDSTLRNIELGHQWGSNELMTAWMKALNLNPADVWIDGSNRSICNGDHAA